MDSCGYPGVRSAATVTVALGGTRRSPPWCRMLASYVRLSGQVLTFRW